MDACEALVRMPQEFSEPTTHNGDVPASRTALCLGSGGLSGAAWQLGVLAGLVEAGLELGAADLIVGTSAGALIGAHLALGRSPQEIAEQLGRLSLDGKLSTPALARLLAAQAWPSRRHALLWLGRRATGSGWSSEVEQRWVRSVGGGLVGQPWPDGLVVVAVDAASGRPAYFTAATAVPLPRAVAASCAIPGVFPPVVIDDRPHFDGGLRSPANLDVADGCDRVLAIAPLTGSLRAHRRPAAQASRLARGARVLLIEPDGPARRAIGVDVVSVRRLGRAMAEGHRSGLDAASEARALFG